METSRNLWLPGWPLGLGGAELRAGGTYKSIGWNLSGPASTQRFLFFDESLLAETIRSATRPATVERLGTVMEGDSPGATAARSRLNTVDQSFKMIEAASGFTTRALPNPEEGIGSRERGFASPCQATA